MSKALSMFVQIAKRDDAKREVSGIATAEVIDKEGEIFDYASSVPYFKNWSDEISKATDGKSLGNIREMHEPSAVGKLTDITFDDDLKQIQVVAKIVDEAAWQKCLQGVYTGFSIGGSYVKAWKDGEAIRFTAKPVEISVVDNPCVPTAHFTAVKLDGSIEICKFAPRELKKDMYSVSSLASLLQSAVYLQMDATYEAEYEADDSKIPEDLKTWVKLGADILARMTEEELNELTARMKAATDKIGKKHGAERVGIDLISFGPFEKVGAKHSAETKAHHAAIAKCMGTISRAAATAQNHCDALMGKDMDSAAMPSATKATVANNDIVIEPGPLLTKFQKDWQPEFPCEVIDTSSAHQRGVISQATYQKALKSGVTVFEIRAALPNDVKAELAKQVPADVEPKIETTESNMNETQVKQLEKAAADSASTLSKFAEVEKTVTAVQASMTELKAETEKNNGEIGKTLGNILKLLETLAPKADSSEQRVARTDLNPTVFKRDDTVVNKEAEAKDAHTAMKTALQTPQNPRQYA